MIIMSREFRQTIFSYRIVHLDLHNRLLDPQSGGGLRGNVSLSPRIRKQGTIPTAAALARVAKTKTTTVKTVAKERIL